MRSRIPKEQTELLGKVPLFSSCTQSELRSIARLGTPIDAEEGAVLTQQGKPGREFFLVLDGVASCRVGSKEVKKFRAGGYFGELALLHGGLRTADVVATTPMELLVFDSREFRTMLTTTPNIGVKMLANLAERLTEADAQFTH
ncbi:MAG TPA: cyclic nucleotide-binding domain-containing protein [Acidimicrobiales bacterium]